MARIISPEEAEALVPVKSTAKYPWDEWLDGNHWVLTQAEDFPAVKNITAFQERIREVARERGMTARVSKVGADTIVVRASKANLAVAI